MDTFMEKLAQKFTAQEIIKANSAAEVEEMDRLKAQVQEYSECLDRMKTICAEIEQTAQTAKDKMESAQLDTSELREELLKMWQDRKSEESGDDAFDADGAVSQQLSQQLDAIKAIEESIRSAQTEQAEKLWNIQTEQLENLRSVQAEQTETIRNMQQDQLDNMRSVLKAQLSGLKDNQVDGLREVLESHNESLSASLGELKTNVETQLGNSNEFVHKECVKVYRNVQAVIGDENVKQTENLDYTLKPMAKRVQTVLKLSVAALVVSLAGVALQVAGMLHLF